MAGSWEIFNVVQNEKALFKRMKGRAGTSQPALGVGRVAGGCSASYQASIQQCAGNYWLSTENQVLVYKVYWLLRRRHSYHGRRRALGSWNKLASALWPVPYPRPQPPKTWVQLLFLSQRLTQAINWYSMTNQLEPCLALCRHHQCHSHRGFC